MRLLKIAAGEALVSIPAVAAPTAVKDGAKTIQRAIGRSMIYAQH